MDELGKVRRTVGREVPDAPHEALLVLDATTGQNALSQAAFTEPPASLEWWSPSSTERRKGGRAGRQPGAGIPVRWIGVGKGSTTFAVRSGEFVTDSSTPSEERRIATGGAVVVECARDTEDDPVAPVRVGQAILLAEDDDEQFQA
jgi:hypothetical protein